MGQIPREGISRVPMHVVNMDPWDVYVLAAHDLKLNIETIYFNGLAEFRYEE